MQPTNSKLLLSQNTWMISVSVEEGTQNCAALREQFQFNTKSEKWML
jgi:hypothetical protein